MALFPTSKRNFPSRANGEDAFDASDINNLNTELRAVIDYLGVVSKAQNIGLNDLLLNYRQVVAISVTTGDTVSCPAQRMIIDQRMCANTAAITRDLTEDIPSPSTGTTYYVYAVDSNVPAGTFTIKFRTSSANNFVGERKIGSVTTATTGSPPDIVNITDDDATTAIDSKLIKAWCTFNGTGTPAYLDSFNFSGAITDNGVGDYTLTIDTDFANANYSAAINVMGEVDARVAVGQIKPTILPLVGSIRIMVNEATAGSALDLAWVSVILIGDQ